MAIRKPNDSAGKGIFLRISHAETAFSKFIGAGNLSEGIRTALRHHKLFSWIKKELNQRGTDKNNRSVYLYDEDIEIAKNLGNGNLSNGIKIALQNYKTVTPVSENEVPAGTNKQKRTIYLHGEDWILAKLIGNNFAGTGIRRALHKHKVFTYRIMPPLEKGDWSPSCAHLYAEDIKTSKLLGHNRISQGVRVALAEYKEYLQSAPDITICKKIKTAYLSDDDIKTARHIGQNNVSEGISRALARYNGHSQAPAPEKTNADLRKRSIRISPDDIKLAETIGNGSFTVGVRKALRAC